MSRHIITTTVTATTASHSTRTRQWTRRLLFALLACAVLACAAVARGAIIVDSADFAATQDSWVDQENPTVNYGSDTTMERKAGWPTSTQKYPYFDFGVANVLATIPEGAAIYNANVTLDRVSATGNAAARIGYVTTAWDENTITWNNAPGHFRFRYGGPLGTGAGTTILDVTTYVDELRRTGSGSASYRLSGGGEDGGQTTVFSTREAGAQAAPQLTVEWVPSERLYTPGMVGDDLVLRLQQGLNGYSGTTDTMVTNRSAGPHGNSATFNLENNWGGMISRGLVRFDLENLGFDPAGAIIGGATLMLMPGSFQTATSISITVRELEKPWTGDATWDTYDGINLWDSGGAAGAGDQSAVIYSTSLNDINWGMMHLDVTDSVIEWLANPAANYGWIIDAVSATQNIVGGVGTSNNASIYMRPQLWIQLAIPEPTSAMIMGLASLIVMRRRRRNG